MLRTCLKIKLHIKFHSNCIFIFFIAGKNVRYITNLFKEVPFQANHSLGVELDVSMDVISQIETDYKGNSLRIRRELISYWIHNATAKATLHYLKAVAKKLGEASYRSMS